ncbi:winged helix-turn-helix domain-containing protein [Roseibium polysiphoniae]|uniref:ArsR/SmtB family transcription factor n=1 Tax=Roseibium polysiphoniae TaxID=2571221 RepID=UPI00329736B1
MRDGPDIALIGSLIGDPARANMLTALMSGKALTASELTAEAGITAQTANSHLGKLANAGLIDQRKQGRHRYYVLSDDDVGQALESLMGLAAKKGHLRVRTGPNDPALRKARVCYDHLAGDLGVRIYDSLLSQSYVTPADDGSMRLTESGNAFLQSFGINPAHSSRSRRPQCRACLDWSERRYHLAGSTGHAIYLRLLELGWAQRLEASRVVQFSSSGEKNLLAQFPILNG